MQTTFGPRILQELGVVWHHGIGPPKKRTTRFLVDCDNKFSLCKQFSGKTKITFQHLVLKLELVQLGNIATLGYTSVSTLKKNMIESVPSM